MVFEVKVRNGNAAGAALADLKARLRSAAGRGVEKYAKGKAGAVLRRATPKRTGHLRRSWAVREMEERKRYRFGNRARYADFAFRHPRHAHRLPKATEALARGGAAAVRDEIKQELESMND